MKYRTEKDSMGEVQVPSVAMFGAQTQRAIENFTISDLRFGRPFIRALGLIKKHATKVNAELGLLDRDVATIIERAADEVAEGRWDSEFPIDVFQTGSGTSTNMNANEVIANRAMQLGEGKLTVHPNDHVNLGQSSNDVFPTAMRVAVAMEISERLVPTLERLRRTFLKKGKEYRDVVMTGRTHLMDATPIKFEQRVSGYARQIELSIARVLSAMDRLLELPQGGTAVGTGVNTHRKFGRMFAESLAKATGLEFREAKNHFEAQASLGAVAEVHGQLKVLATELIKIANDLRWMNSGPNNGLGEIQLPTLQPGSSIMPGKVNPVIEEAVVMVAMKVIGNDTTVTLAAQSGNLDLNVAMTVVAHCLLESIELISNATEVWAEKSIAKLVVNRERIARSLEKNPILATALNSLIGYDRAARVVKRAMKEDRSLIEVAVEECPEIEEEELRGVLDVRGMVGGK